MSDSNDKGNKLGMDEHQVPDERLRYECEQAFLRRHFTEPSVNEEWERFQCSLSRNVQRKKRITYYILSGLSAAAIISGVIFFVLHDNKAQRGRSKEAMEVLITSISKEQQVVIEESGDGMPKERTTIAVNAVPTVERQGAVLSAKGADYTHVNAKRVRRNVVSIPRGKVYKIVLNDGTEVWLNAHSRFSFPTWFSGDKREVTLEGEAYFKVMHEENRPFIIVTDKITTQVLGTELNVKAYKDSEAHVTLVRGAVCVRLPHKAEGVLLSPGDDMVCADDSFQIKKVDTSYYSQWMEGVFYYDDVSLVDILRDLGRWYNLSVEIEQEPALMSLRLHFVAERSDSIDKVIENLNAYEYLSVTKKGNRLVVKRKNKETDKE
ncbi:FecR family protein [Bacteroides sp. AN502(2024)]|uniref:FecR family protein n=1 Tax=Bacteroides sp. AN502(2024) TaxID=3160599 RepID=UPI0035120CD3